MTLLPMGQQSGLLTPQQIQRRQAVSNLLIQSGTGAQPTTALGALGSLGQTLAGALIGRRADKAQTQRNQAANQALLALVGGGAQPGAAVASGAPAPAMPPATSPLVPSAGPPAQAAAAAGLGPAPMPGMATSGAGGSPGALAQLAGPGAPSTGALGGPQGALGALAGQSGGGGASVGQMLQLAQQFPQLAGVLNPMISAAITPQKPTVLSPGQVAVNRQGQVVARGGPKTPEFRTDLGKAMADRDLAIQTYGKDSPQAQAMAEVVAAERSGQTEIDLSDEAGQRKEFSRLSGDFIALRDAFGKIQGARDTAAGDLSLIFNYMKMLDPGSVVREGEFATAQNTAGVPERVRNTYNRLMTGERLSSNQRTNFKQQAGDVFATQRRQQNLLEDQFRGLAGRSGLRPDNVVVDFQGDLRDFDPESMTAGMGGGNGGGGADTRQFSPDELQAMSDDEIRALLQQ